MTLLTIFNIATAIFTGLWGTLKIIAPLTKTKKDDNILKIINNLSKLFSIQVKNEKLEIFIKKK